MIKKINLISSFGLLLSLPLFIIISIAIKIDFFSFKKDMKGKEFKMYKFRTIFKDAEKIHKKLIERKDIDGPMFKMVNDPRITRLGRFFAKLAWTNFPSCLTY